MSSNKNSPDPSQSVSPRSTGDKESFEKEEIELELKKLTSEYTNLLNSNLELSFENTKKESYIIEQHKKLSLLKERNDDDLSQYDLEVEVVVERYEYGLKQANEKLGQLKSQKVKLNEVMENSQTLEKTINSILVKMGTESLEHAIEVHDMNKKLQDVRKKMEDHLRRDVAQLDLGYQNVAFQCLDDPKKIAMLTNAKLKDEVTLQGVGMANLGVRLKSQARSYKKVKEQIGILHRNAKILRERLGELKLNKLHLLKEAEDLHYEENDLLQEKEHLYSILEAAPVTEEIHDNIKEIEVERIKAISKMNLWVKRLELLEGMYASIKPVTDFEKNGKYKVENFNMIPHDTTTAIDNKEIKTKSYMPPLSEVEEFMANDKYLTKALAPLEGKLSRLVTDPQVFSGIEYQNMVTWVTHQVIYNF
jgi:chromosome segregation ATPase